MVPDSHKIEIIEEDSIQLSKKFLRGQVGKDHNQPLQQQNLVVSRFQLLGDILEFVVALSLLRDQYTR